MVVEGGGEVHGLIMYKQAKGEGKTGKCSFY